MSFTIEKTLATPQEVIRAHPLSAERAQRIKEHRQEIKNIIAGKDKRVLLIIGPCSAWPDGAVMSYARRLSSISQEVGDKIKIVLRTYTQKPRTTIGWKGPVFQKNPQGEEDLDEGIAHVRKLFLDLLEFDLPLADEAVFPELTDYTLDLLSYVAIGARSAESMQHRCYASMISLPVGLKNPTSGSIEIGVNNVIAAQHPHVFFYRDKQISSKGNPYAHLVLRGGSGKSNTSKEELELALKLLREKTKNPAIIVDVSHDNSLRDGKKDPRTQPGSIMRIREYGIKEIKGFMVESFLKEGKQDITTTKDLDLGGISITDACLGWEETQQLILDLYKQL